LTFMSIELILVRAKGLQATQTQTQGPRLRLILG
jgi:hypothetical protein